MSDKDNFEALIKQLESDHARLIDENKNLKKQLNIALESLERERASNTTLKNLIEMKNDNDSVQKDLRASNCNLEEQLSKKDAMLKKIHNDHSQIAKKMKSNVKKLQKMLTDFETDSGEPRRKTPVNLL